MTNSYDALAPHYDLIMTSGYYDYDAYARELRALIGNRRDVLELGVGTGLVCDRLLATGPTGMRITGIDHTERMLAQARNRLGDRVELVEMDILYAVPESTFDVAFSVGGIWYCLRDGDEITLGSHLVEESDNIKGLRNLATALRPGGLLVLAVQDAHHALRRTLPGGLVYAQESRAEGGGRFTKDYYVMRETTVVAHQRSGYRVFGAADADRLMEQCGFRRQSGGDEPFCRPAQYMQYVRV
ncbi:class I SAM-dependent methyltransferase [Streptomyces sp. NPDC050439]|uniref:class I SAM-dependent DNA methyltransferase n=1 Tax=unclassified Streptomyces TaxID=2593676 RepID=UPI0034369DFC